LPKFGLLCCKWDYVVLGSGACLFCGLEKVGVKKRKREGCFYGSCIPPLVSVVGGLVSPSELYFHCLSLIVPKTSTMLKPVGLYPSVLEL
jgi:hypothetical protein